MALIGKEGFKLLSKMSRKALTGIENVGEKTATKILNGVGNGTITAETDINELKNISEKARTSLQNFITKNTPKKKNFDYQALGTSQRANYANQSFGSAVTGTKQPVWDDIERKNIMSGDSEYAGGIKQSENDMVKSVRDTTYDDLIESTGVNPETLEDTTDVEEFVKTKEQIAEEKIKKKNEYDALKAKREEELNNYDEDWNQKIFDASVESSQATFSDNAKEAAAEAKKAAKKEARRQRNEEYGEGFNKYKKKIQGWFKESSG